MVLHEEGGTQVHHVQAGQFVQPLFQVIKPLDGPHAFGQVGAHAAERDGVGNAGLPEGLFVRPAHAVLVRAEVRRIVPGRNHEEGRPGAREGPGHVRRVLHRAHEGFGAKGFQRGQTFGTAAHGPNLFPSL